MLFSINLVIPKTIYSEAIADWSSTKVNQAGSNLSIMVFSDSSEKIPKILAAPIINKAPIILIASEANLIKTTLKPPSKTAVAFPISPSLISSIANLIKGLIS